MLYIFNIILEIYNIVIFKAFVYLFGFHLRILSINKYKKRRTIKRLRNALRNEPILKFIGPTGSTISSQTPVLDINGRIAGRIMSPTNELIKWAAEVPTTNAVDNAIMRYSRRKCLNPLKSFILLFQN